MNWKINNLQGWESIAKYIINHKKYSIVRLEGEMGAGKTTFVAQLLREMGSEDDISSPTYALVNEYHTPSGKVFHFDLYRLRDAEELQALGFDEYLDGGDLCLIEWGNSFPEAFEGRDFHTLYIIENEGQREVSFQ